MAKNGAMAGNPLQPSLLGEDPAKAGTPDLAALERECRECRRCGLAEGRQTVVVSRGDPAARLMVIGEGPGAQEDASGRPFVGRAGQLLDQMLASVGLDSERDAYVCNVVKCRPPDNRRPTPQEIAACAPWLAAQIAAVDPSVVLLAGDRPGGGAGHQGRDLPVAGPLASLAGPLGDARVPSLLPAAQSLAGEELAQVAHLAGPAGGAASSGSGPTADTLFVTGFGHHRPTRDDRHPGHTLHHRPGDLPPSRPTGPVTPASTR